MLQASHCHWFAPLAPRGVLALAGLVLCGGGAALGQVWDANAQFSGTDNPTGAWSYGVSSSRFAAFGPFSSHASISTVVYWGNGAPGIWKNLGGGAVQIADNPVLPGGVMMAHPGPGGENAVLRWTSPVSGNVRAVVRFGGVDIDPNGDSVDVSVLKNGQQLFAANVDGLGTHADYAGWVGVEVGDTLDFKVGFGSNGNYFNDSTALSVVISTCLPDAGMAGGVPGHDGLLDNNDFIAFINLFFDGAPAADLGAAGGVLGSDGQFDNNDFISFINLFFAGCG